LDELVGYTDQLFGVPVELDTQPLATSLKAFEVFKRLEQLHTVRGFISTNSLEDAKTVMQRLTVKVGVGVGSFSE